jgi:hypothetical protein
MHLIYHELKRAGVAVKILYTSAKTLSTYQGLTT